MTILIKAIVDKQIIEYKQKVSDRPTASVYFDVLADFAEEYGDITVLSMEVHRE